MLEHARRLSRGKVNPKSDAGTIVEQSSTQVRPLQLMLYKTDRRSRDVVITNRWDFTVPTCMARVTSHGSSCLVLVSITRSSAQSA
jgi:hypothetical protein